MENKRKRYSLAVLFAIMLCFVSCVFNVHAEKYSPTDAGEVIIYKSFETGEARYINYTKNSNTETYGLSQDNYSYETDAYIPNSAATKSVIGDDGRLPATNTEVFPNAAVLYVTTKWPDGSASRGTAFMVNKTQAMTAGHRVYSSKHGGMATSITVIPARSGDSKPYGTHAVKSMYVGGKSPNTNADWGVLTLKTDLGLTTGYYGVRLSASNLTSTVVRITGYPADKSGYLMWTQKGKITGDSNYRLSYKIDTYGGQSGSPIYQPSNYRVVGIHTTGNSSANSGVKISDRLFQLIGGKIVDPGGFSDGEYYTDSKDGPFTDGSDFTDGSK